MVAVSPEAVMRGMGGAGSLGGALGKLAPLLGGSYNKIATFLGASQGALVGAGQGIGTGVGFSLGQLIAQPVKGFFGFFVNFVPENVYGVFLWFAAVIYFFDWQTGFNMNTTAQAHIWFAVAFWLIIGITQGFLKSGWTWISAISLFWSLISFIRVDFTDIGMNLLTVKEFALPATFFVFSLYFNQRSNATGFYKLIPVILFLDIYVMPLWADRLRDQAQNIALLSVAAAFFFNRILFPIWLWFGMLGLQENTRVAKKLFFTVMVFYLVVSMPAISARARSSVSNLTPEEKEVATSVWSRFKTNAGNILSGKFLQNPVNAAYEKANQLYGFGDANEEQPPMGLQLASNPKMPKMFDLSFYDAASPTVIMSIPNPLPADLEMGGGITVKSLTCKAQSSGITDDKPTPEVPAGGLKISYGRPRTVKCSLTGLPEGSNTATIEARYNFNASSLLLTTFMRSDIIDDPTNPDNLAKIKRVPPAQATFDNGPVAVTWDPIELYSPPVSVNTEGTSPATYDLTVYVAAAAGSAWKGEIFGINTFTLEVPPGVSLCKDSTCAEKTSASDDAQGQLDKRCAFYGTGPLYYVKSDMINRKTNDKTESRFIGDGMQFSCPIAINPEALEGRESFGAQFKASVGYTFSTKQDVSFEVKGCSTRDPVDCTCAAGTAGKKTCTDNKWSDCSCDGTSTTPQTQGTTEGTTPASLAKVPGAFIPPATANIALVPNNEPDATNFQKVCRFYNYAADDIKDTGGTVTFLRCTCPAGKNWVDTKDITMGCG